MALQVELWEFETLQGYTTQYDMRTTPPAPSKKDFAAAGLTVDGVLAGDNKAGAQKSMAALGLPRQAPFAAAIKRAKKVRESLAKQAKQIPPVFWVRKARGAFGQGTPRRRRHLWGHCLARCAGTGLASFCPATLRSRAPSMSSPVWRHVKV